MRLTAERASVEVPYSGAAGREEAGAARGGMVA